MQSRPAPAALGAPQEGHCGWRGSREPGLGGAETGAGGLSQMARDLVGQGGECDKCDRPLLATFEFGGLIQGG